MAAVSREEDPEKFTAKFSKYDKNEKENLKPNRSVGARAFAAPSTAAVAHDFLPFALYRNVHRHFLFKFCSEKFISQINC